jgi:hypothetical protein
MVVLAAVDHLGNEVLHFVTPHPIVVLNISDLRFIGLESPEI